MKTKEGFEIYEAKYYSGKMKETEMLEEEKQIKQIQDMKITKIGFITVGGVEKKIDSFSYIDGKELYQPD